MNTLENRIRLSACLKALTALVFAMLASAIRSWRASGMTPAAWLADAWQRDLAAHDAIAYTLRTVLDQHFGDHLWVVVPTWRDNKTPEGKRLIQSRDEKRCPSYAKTQDTKYGHMKAMLKATLDREAPENVLRRFGEFNYSADDDFLSQSRIYDPEQSMRQMRVLNVFVRRAARKAAEARKAS